jgi:hypothetical protein
MSRKAIRRAIPHVVNEPGIDFEKVEDNKYKLTTKAFVKDTETYAKISEEKEISDKLFEIVAGDIFDYEFSYEDIDGTMKSLKFKEVDSDETG